MLLRSAGPVLGGRADPLVFDDGVSICTNLVAVWPMWPMTIPLLVGAQSYSRFLSTNLGGSYVDVGLLRACSRCVAPC